MYCSNAKRKSEIKECLCDKTILSLRGETKVIRHIIEKACDISDVYVSQAALRDIR